MGERKTVNWKGEVEKLQVHDGLIKLGVWMSKTARALDIYKVGHWTHHYPGWTDARWQAVGSS